MSEDTAKNEIKIKFEIGIKIGGVVVVEDEVMCSVTIVL